MKVRILTIVGLAVYGVIILLPPIIHGYVYPNVGDDSGGYLAVFDAMQRGVIKPQVQYAGYILVGYPLVFLSNVTSVDIDVIFLWFNFAVLVVVGLVLYFVMTRLVNRLAGWLALLLVIFCSQGILLQFYYGQIFNIINVGIILPLLILATVRYLQNGKRIHLIYTVLLGLLFAGFHTSGIYLPVFAGVAIIIYVGYGIICKAKIQKRAIALGGVVVISSAVAFVMLVLTPTLGIIARYYEEPPLMLLSQIGKTLAIPLTNYFLSIVSIAVLVLVGLLIVYRRDIVDNIKLNGNRTLIVLLISMIIVLSIAAFAKLSLDPWRQALDLATVFALFVAVCVATLLNHQRTTLVVISVVLSIGFGLYHNLPAWLGYNSAIYPVDLKALAYVDNYKTYSCSGTIAPHIYNRFTEADWVPENGEVVIVRSKPMTPRSDEDSIWYQNHGWQPDDNYRLAKVFSDDGLSIEIYELRKKDE